MVEWVRINGQNVEVSQIVFPLVIVLTQDCDLAQDDAVDHPSHYNSGKIEVIDAIEDWNLGFHLGNVVKYIARSPHKGTPIEDLKKAKWYLDRYIENVAES
jgi:hypothetical protein